MKKLLVLGAVLLGLLAIGPSSALASATCTSTGFIRDGINLTAALIGPASVTGEVDATGCDIGVFVGSGSTSISSADIHGARYFGVAVVGATASASISGSSIHDIGDVPQTGAQHGVAIFYTGGATGTVGGNAVWAYQKNGMAITGAGTSVAVTDNTVTGAGPTDRIAQNGIQVSSGATATVTGNTVSDNIYTQAPPSACPRPEGVGSCVGVISTGILFFQAGADYKTGDIAKANHAFRNQCNNCVID